MKFKILIPVYNDWQSVTDLLDNIDYNLSGVEHEISIIIVKNNNPKKRRLKISLANLFDCFFPLVVSDEQLGTNAALKVPSANNLLKVFGILNATKNASASNPVPRKIAIKISLK